MTQTSGTAAGQHVPVYWVYLEGLQLPATEERIIKQMRQNDAPRDVVAYVQKNLGGGTFESFRDILEACGTGIK